jgi:hypothetical protein
MNIPTSPLWIDSRRCLGYLPQQEAQQGTALFADVPQSLFVTTGVFTRNHSHVAASLLAAWKAFPGSNNEHQGQGSLPELAW